MATYLALNAVVIAVSAAHVARDAHLMTDWTASLSAEHGNVAIMIAVSLTLFPQLALEILYDARAEAFYRDKIRQIVDDHDLPNSGDIVFVEVTVGDYSDFESRIEVHGEVLHDEYRVLTVTGASVPNMLASLLLDIRDHTGVRPHIYFEWTEGNPAMQLVRFLMFGGGEVAPVTREVLRRAEADPGRRPHIHAG